VVDKMSLEVTIQYFTVRSALYNSHENLRNEEQGVGLWSFWFSLEVADGHKVIGEIDAILKKRGTSEMENFT
jgi:hypothetical protein